MSEGIEYERPGDGVIHRWSKHCRDDGGIWGEETTVNLTIPDNNLGDPNSLRESKYAHNLENSNRQKRQVAISDARGGDKGLHVAEPTHPNFEEWRNKCEVGPKVDLPERVQTPNFECTGPQEKERFKDSELEWMIENDIFNIEPLLTDCLAQNILGRKTQIALPEDNKLPYEEWAQAVSTRGGKSRGGIRTRHR